MFDPVNDMYRMESSIIFKLLHVVLYCRPKRGYVPLQLIRYPSTIVAAERGFI